MINKNIRQISRKIILGLCFMLFLTSSHTFAQNTQEKFGKNRIQYKKFTWRNLSTFNFDIYYYDNGSRLANFATRYLESEFDEITDILGYTPYFKAKIFIYNSITDLQQSNVGIDDDNVITGGQTDFFKSQVEIPYTGNEVDFKIELRKGIALMLIREMMFGGSLKDMLQSSYLGKFSEWFLLGAAAYVAEGWSEEMDDHLRDLLNNRKLKKPNLLSGDDAVLVGQSIWNFIAEEYGAANISNILNLARIIRNERNSIGSSLGIRYKSFLDRWEEYYRIMGQEVLANTEDAAYDFKLRKRNRKGFEFNELKISPDGTKIAYSENFNGKYCVIVQNLLTKKRRVLLRYGYKAINQRYDDNIPLLAWRDNNNLGIMLAKKGETKLSVYNLKKKKSYERIWYFFNHVSGFDFSDDGNRIILSADRTGQVNFKTGQNDVFVFDLETTTLEQVTDDWFDDLDPEFLPNSNLAFTFSSNRTDDTLRSTLLTDRGNFNLELNNYDIFIYNPLLSSTRVQRLTDSPAKDLKPRVYDNNTILYLNQEQGISQLHKVDIKTGKNQALSNYNQSMRRFDMNRIENGLAFLMLKKGRLFPYYDKDFNLNNNATTNFITGRMKILGGRNPESRVITPRKTPENFTDSSEVVPPSNQQDYQEDEIDTDNYEFDQDIVQEKQSGLDKAREEMQDIVDQTAEEKVKVVGPYDYEPRFRTENVVTSVQIDPLRGWGFLMNLTTSDLLENHKIRGGFFLVTDLKSSDFFAEYQYYGHRLDYKLRFDRKTIFLNNSDLTQRYTQNKASTTISYPIRNTSRISITPFYTSTLWTSLDLGFIPLRNHRIHYAGARVEYVYDNTILNGQNMIAGTRIKIAYENYQSVVFNKGFKDQIADRIGIKADDLSFDKLSVDIRNYTKIHRDLIFAVRIAYGRFGGNAPKNFLLGGMDNWLFNQTDDGGGDVNPLATAFNQDNSDLLFTEFVTNLRGFNYNKIAGENFFLANLELRFPIIKYLFGKRVNSNFLKNLQLVGFYDVGSAWTGISPFNRENSINTRNIFQPGAPFTATVNDFKNPWLAGYGAGLRTVLLGYYLKLDVAWGIEDFIVADKPKFYLTFGYDF